MMGIFDGADEEEGIARLRRRIKKLPTADLREWLRIALSGMMRQLETYERTGDKAYLGELGIAEMSVNLVVSELMDRADD